MNQNKFLTVFAVFDEATQKKLKGFQNACKCHDNGNSNGRVFPYENDRGGRFLRNDKNIALPRPAVWLSRRIAAFDEELSA